MKEEFAAQAALRDKERETSQMIEEEKQRMEEGFRRNMDWLKEEKDAQLQEKG